MLTIRLTRVGKKNDPSFRVIVVESKRKPQPGNYLEMVGSHDPRTNRTELQAERIKHWIANGATVSDTVHNILVTNKIIDAKKINILPAFKKIEEKAAPVAEKKVAEAAPEVAEAPVVEAASQTAQVLAKEGEDNEVAPETPAE